MKNSEFLIDRSIAASDKMFEGDSAHYFSVGSSALTAIQTALSAAECSPDNILDFGCGAGRVTRWIRAAYPRASIEGCDIRKEDIGFVAEKFGAKTWISGIDVSALSAPSTYDLIWVGSVFTHLSLEVSIQLFDKLMSWLKPNGVLVFTSHGRHVLTRGETSGFYGVPEQWQRVVRDFQSLRYGYADYAKSPGYGISIVSPAWWFDLVSSRDGLRVVGMTERGWDGHQDAIAVQRC